MGAPGPDHETWKKMSKVDKIIYCISIAAGLSFTLYVAFSGYFK
jgi:cell division protein FtsL